MSNSSLISYTKLSPNHSGKRTHAIDTISIHCMAGNLSIESCGNLFANRSAGASSNYGIGSDGRIALYVDEANRSWCTSSSSNDHRAITIEVANTKAGEPYPISNEAYDSLIKLCADICKRNNIKQLLWKADKSLIGQVDKQNMTVHRWFAAKSCPGQWLYENHGKIANDVNKLLGNTTIETSSKPQVTTNNTTTVMYCVQINAYSNKAVAESQLQKIKAAGINAFIVLDKTLYKIQVGNYSTKANADSVLKELKTKGYSGFVTTTSGQNVNHPERKEMKVGSKVRVNQGAKTYVGGNLASFVYNRDHDVHSMNGDRVVISYNGTIVAVMNAKDLAVV